MKKIFFKMLALLTISATMVGCQDYLDEQPNSTWGVDEFYSSPVEADIALAGMYGVFATDDIYGRNLSIIMDSGTDEGYYNRRYNENWTVGLYRHTPSDNYIKNFWGSLYEIINLSNLFEERLKADSFTEEEYDRYLAESRFLRAHSYFLLVSWFNEVPMPLSSTKDQTANDIPPSSLQEIYAQIVDDFSFATEHLPKVNDADFVPGRVTNMAAHGMMARVYLKMAGFPLNDTEKYVNAKEQAKIVIDDGAYGLNQTDGNGYRSHFLNYIENTYDTKESLFEISFAFLRETGLDVDGRIGGLNGVPFNYGGGQDGYPAAYAQLNASPVVLNSYKNEDQRKDWNLAGFKYTRDEQVKPTDPLESGYTPGTYRRWEPANFDDITEDAPNGATEPYVTLETVTSPNKNFTSINFPVLRYSDILLMYAEAVNEIQGPTSQAVGAINQVRNRAGLENIEMAKPSAVANKESFFRELVNERMRELPFQGLRKMDLIRWELLGERLELLENTIKGMPSYREKNENHQAFLRPSRFFNPAKHLSLPYPLQEVMLNNSLEQKSGW